jgi:hypothetical protein
MVDAMSRGKLLRLATELMQERAVAMRLATGCLADASRLEIASNTDEVRGLMAIVALGLHRWYSAVESMLERIERSLGTLPGGSNWHLELLEVATLEIPKVRPAIVDAEHLDGLRELLKFRHFLRHAYAVELDRAKLQSLVTDLRMTHAGVDAAIARFGDFLAAAAEALDG